VRAAHAGRTQKLYVKSGGGGMRGFVSRFGFCGVRQLCAPNPALHIVPSVMVQFKNHFTTVLMTSIIHINMTKEQITFSVIIPIIISFGAVIFDWMFKTYAKEHIPDTKTLTSYIKKCLRFTVLYILPISLIIFSFIQDNFDKLFILKILILTIGLTFNIYSYFSRRLITSILVLIKNSSNDLNDKNDIDFEIVNIFNKTIGTVSSDDKKEKPNP